MRTFRTKIKRGLQFALSKPSLFGQKLLRLIYRKVRPPRSGMIDVNGVYFEIDLELDAVMGLMYYGWYEPDMISPLRKYLHEGDVFIDVGANVGYISAFALGAVGKTGEVHAFEPVPRFFQRL